MLDEFGIPSALVNLSGPFPRLALYDLLFQDLHDFHEFLECRYYQGNLSDLLELSAIQELEYHFHLLRQHLLKCLCHPKWMNQIIFQSDNFHVKKCPRFITLDSKNVKSHEKYFFSLHLVLLVQLILWHQANLLVLLHLFDPCFLFLLFCQAFLAAQLHLSSLVFLRDILGMAHHPHLLYH